MDARINRKTQHGPRCIILSEELILHHSEEPRIGLYCKEYYHPQITLHTFTHASAPSTSTPCLRSSMMSTLLLPLYANRPLALTLCNALANRHGSTPRLSPPRIPTAVVWRWPPVGLAATGYPPEQPCSCRGQGDHWCTDICLQTKCHPNIIYIYPIRCHNITCSEFNHQLHCTCNAIQYYTVTHLLASYASNADVSVPVDLLGRVECPPDTVSLDEARRRSNKHAYNGTTAACTLISLYLRHTSVGMLPEPSPPLPRLLEGHTLSSLPPVSVQCLISLRRGSPSPHVPPTHTNYNEVHLRPSP